jgi:phospholipid/cholesterol/gamma-HCH transport system substrate-binding protein
MRTTPTGRGQLMRDALHRVTPASAASRLIVAGVVVVVIALVSVFLIATSGPSSKQVTAYFNEAIGVYPGSSVEILGIKVGSIDSVQPEGTHVKVTLTVNGGVQVPANAGAVVVAPSVVSDRYIQLIPAYTGGAELADDAVIPASRTATPLEIDQLYNSLNKIEYDLGPNGVNKNGALSDVLNTGAANLAGNGRNFNTLITQLSAAINTLNGSRGNLFGTVSNLQLFTTTLKQDNGQLQLAEQQLAQVTGFLSDDRVNLGGALHELQVALGQVQSFIGNNRALIKSNVSKLASITGVLVKERASLADALDELPLDVDNVIAAYDPATKTLNGRGDVRELTPGIYPGKPGGSDTSASSSSTQTSSPATSSSTSTSSSNLFCASTSASSPLGELCQQEKSAGGHALVPLSRAEQAALPPLPLPAVGTVYGSTGNRTGK